MRRKWGGGIPKFFIRDAALPGRALALLGTAPAQIQRAGAVRGNDAIPRFCSQR